MSTFGALNELTKRLSSLSATAGMASYDGCQRLRIDSCVEIVNGDITVNIRLVAPSTSELCTALFSSTLLHAVNASIQI